MSLGDPLMDAPYPSISKQMALPVWGPAAICGIYSDAAVRGAVPIDPANFFLHIPSCRLAAAAGARQSAAPPAAPAARHGGGRPQSATSATPAAFQCPPTRTSCGTPGQIPMGLIFMRRADYQVPERHRPPPTELRLLRSCRTKAHLQQQQELLRQQAAWTAAAGADSADDAMSTPRQEWNGGRGAVHNGAGATTSSTASLPPTPPNLDRSALRLGCIYYTNLTPGPCQAKPDDPHALNCKSQQSAAMNVLVTHEAVCWLYGRSPKCGGFGGPNASALANRLQGGYLAPSGRRIRSDASSHSTQDSSISRYEVRCCSTF